MSTATPPRFYLLDGLRGWAALAVVVWHYSHFFQVAPGLYPESFVRSEQPLYALLWPLYEKGYLAVELFFVLSGFVFYAIYDERLRNRSVSGFSFLVLRFSRLYPLHFVTLLVVAGLQIGADATLGGFIVYPMNDLKHFVLNLFLVSEWGLAAGHSFNAPIWSVSVEAFLYAVFFALAVATPRSALAPLLMMLLGLCLALLGASHMGWGLFCFFAGGLACKAKQRLDNRPAAQALAIALGLLLFSASATAVLSRDLIAPLLFGGCFPTLVLCLAVLQRIRPNAGRSIRAIGDISYASYLLHFPIQAGALLVIQGFGIPVDFTAPLWLAAYLACVVLLSVPVHYRFERPAQAFLRQQLARQQVSSVAAPTARPVVQTVTKP